MTLGIEPDGAGFRAVIRVDGELYARSEWCETRERAREFKADMSERFNRTLPKYGGVRLDRNGAN